MMRILKQSRLFVAFLFLSGQAACLSSAAQHSNKVFLSGVNLLYGPVSQTELFREYPAWEENFDNYKPDPALLDTLSRFADKGLKSEIFLGTWCGDSRREVPRFLKIVERSGFLSPDSIFLWAVDRNKELDNGLTQKRDISRVATFIIFFHGQEIGRMVERPQTASLEQDILNILKHEVGTGSG
jgi:hypothetical protein